MNTKTILIAVSLIASNVTAADVPYTPGQNPGSGVEMTFDGSGNIATLVATPTDGGTITLTGGAATFADGATITVNAPGTLAFAEKVTTLGALTLARGDNAYLVWSSDSAMPIGAPGVLAFSGVTRADIELVRLASTGPDSDNDVWGQQGLWYCVEGPSNAGFYLFNKVEGIYRVADRIQAAIPAPRAAISSREHGSPAASRSHPLRVLAALIVKMTSDVFSFLLLTRSVTCSSIVQSIPCAR